MEPTIVLRYYGYIDYRGRWVIIDYVADEDGIVVESSPEGVTLDDIRSVTHRRSTIAHPELGIVRSAVIQMARYFSKHCEENGIGPEEGAI